MLVRRYTTIGLLLLVGAAVVALGDTAGLQTSGVDAADMSRMFETQSTAQQMAIGIVSFTGMPPTLPSVTLNNLKAAVAGPVGAAVGRAPWLVQASQQGSNTSIVFGFWFNGSNPEAAAASARTLLTSAWPATPPAGVTSQLSTAALSTVGVTPQRVEFSGDCAFATSTRCESALTVSLTTDVAPPASLIPTVCAALVIDYCSQVTLESTVGPTPQGNFVSVVRIPTLTPAVTLANLLLKARSASQLSLLSISLVQVHGVTVFTVGDLSQRTTTGSMSECVGRQWYLLFLILLAPVSYIVIRWCYSRGKLRGVDIAREQFEDMKVKTTNSMMQQQQQQQQMVYYDQQQQYADMQFQQQQQQQQPQL